MSYLSFKSQYDKYPETNISGFDHEVWSGWAAIGNILAKYKNGNRILVADTYPGVNDEELLSNLTQAFNPKIVICTEDLS